jgi:hypothetical protein
MADDDRAGSYSGILPLTAHLEITAATSLALIRLDPRSHVRGKTEFNAIKAHIADIYTGVEALHSFEGPGGTVFDCIPVEQQPSLRDHRGPIPQPPDLTEVLHGGEPQQRPVSPQPQPDDVERDRHGNARWAPPGTIPFPRLTLEDICRFESLEAFFHKQPGPTAPAPGVLSKPRPGVLNQPSPETEPQYHRYAVAEQPTANIGGHSAFALYAPSIEENQWFSLSQQWYVSGEGPARQTVEVGWQVSPKIYKHAMPVLFIFWSDENYKRGNYNLTNKSFVATSSGEALIGNALSPVTIVGGQQMEIEITVYLYEGNWWIYCGGVKPENALGYYPTSLWNEGGIRTGAEIMKLGGETCSKVENSWPPMGSGAFAASSWGSAAYHRAIYYFPTAGGSEWDNKLRANEPNPAMYTLGPQPWEESNVAALPWGQYFFYGGPGE